MRGLWKIEFRLLQVPVQGFRRDGQGHVVVGAIWVHLVVGASGHDLSDASKKLPETGTPVLVPRLLKHLSSGHGDVAFALTACLLGRDLFADKKVKLTPLRLRTL